MPPGLARPRSSAPPAGLAAAERTTSNPGTRPRKKRRLSSTRKETAKGNWLNRLRGDPMRSRLPSKKKSRMISSHGSKITSGNIPLTPIDGINTSCQRHDLNSMGDPHRHRRDEARAQERDLNRARPPPLASQRGGIGRTRVEDPPPDGQGAPIPETVAPRLVDGSSGNNPPARQTGASDAIPGAQAPHPADAVRRAAGAQNPAADARVRDPALQRDLP